MQTTIHQTFFRLIRASVLSGEDAALRDWKAVFAEMRAQSVAALPGTWLKEHGSPETEPWVRYCCTQQGNWIRVLNGQRELLDLLNQNGIPCVIIKGAAASMYYPYPSLRMMGDVDFLVKREDYEKTAALMEVSGYELAHEKNPKQHHYTYKKDHIFFELHNRLGTVDESDESLISLFERGIDQREWREAEGFRFPVLPVHLNGLSLIFHINQHLRGGLGFRQIIDWMMYVNALSDAEWREMQPLLKETGMQRLAFTVTVMCQKYIGFRHLVDDDGSLPADELAMYIMEKGNFGRKAGVRGKTAEVSLSSVGRGGLLKRLQIGGLCRWEAARRNRLLRPFAWIYQSFRIIGLFLKNRISPFEILAQWKRGKEQRKLIKALGLKIDRTVKKQRL
ncbi:MAG: nucleotidyltransferase family protein [Lachnospiraceae bacterium]|nr:nucleotidyltransferase family protein [Lachnospiraceae bacterium]